MMQKSNNFEKVSILADLPNNNGKIIPEEYPMSQCLNQVEGYGTAGKSNKDQLGTSPFKN